MHSWTRDAAALAPVDRRPGAAGAAVEALDARPAGRGGRGEPADAGQRRAGRGEPQRRDAVADQRRARRRAARAGGTSRAEAASRSRASGEGAVLWTRRGRRARRAGGRHRAAGRGRAVGLDPGSGGPARQRGPHARHEGAAAGPGGLDHARGRRPGRSRSMPATRSRSPATSPTATPTRATPSRRGSPWRCSSRVVGPGRRDRRSSMADVGALEEFLAGGSGRRRRVRAAARLPRPAAGRRRARARPERRGQRGAAPGGRGRGPRGAAAIGRSSSSRTWPRGERPTGRSAPSRSAPATAWRRCCAERASGLPRVNRLTDLYNAVSVLHQIPLGGEDLTRYAGSPRLVRATGTSRSTPSPTAPTVIEHPDPGEVVWCDDAGVTCRRWNWRQARRTQLREDTTTALFILDALDPHDRRRAAAAADDLVAPPGPARSRRARRPPADRRRRARDRRFGMISRRP